MKIIKMKRTRNLVRDKLWIRCLVDLISRCRRTYVALTTLLFLSLSACSTNKTIGVDVVGYNHTDYSIGYFSVNESGGPYIGAHEGGGKFTCCFGVPREYQPGMTVKIRWKTEDPTAPDGIGPEQERIVSVPPYQPKDIGLFAVHFLKSGEIRVFVTMMGLGHPDYPLKGEEAKK